MHAQLCGNRLDTNGKNNASIEGPGLIRRFNGIGIVVSGNHSEVEGVAVTSICGDGIRVLGSQNEVEGNSISRASPGIFLHAPGGHNSILHNECNGGGIIVGEGLPVFSSKNNLIQGNNASIFIDIGSIGNTIRNNQALGAAPFGFDIRDNTALPANTYDNNLCERSQIGGQPGANDICRLPNIAGHRNFNPDGD